MPTLATNKRARFDYEILETFEAGIVLSGQEVKSAKLGNVSLKASYVVVDPKGASLINAHIGQYLKAGKITGYEPTHSRRLLLKSKELKYFQGKTHEQGLTLVPLSMYTRRTLVKVEVGLGKGKKKYDKRETIKNREWKRQQKRITS